MTNLYETLGVTQQSTMEDIEAAYKKRCSYFTKKQLEEDQSLKIYFDDITLAYSTLVNSVSRKEYDDYISQNQRVANFWNEDGKEEEEDPEVVAERERRRKERGKKRYEEDYSFVNEEFFFSWQNRTNNHSA